MTPNPKFFTYPCLYIPVARLEPRLKFLEQMSRLNNDRMPVNLQTSGQYLPITLFQSMDVSTTQVVGRQLRRAGKYGV